MPPPGFKKYIAQPHSSFRPSVVWSQVFINVSTASGSSSQVTTALVSAQFSISEHYSSSDTSRFFIQPPSNFVKLASLRSSTLKVPNPENLSTSSQSTFLPYGATACLEQTEHVPAYHPTDSRTSPVQLNNHALSMLLLDNLLAQQHMNFQLLGQPFVLYITISQCILTIVSSLNQNCQNSTEILSTTETLCSTSKRT